MEKANLELDKVVSKKEKEVVRLKDLLKHNKAAAEANLEASKKDTEAIAAGEIAALKQALQTSKNEIAENQNKAEMAYKDLQARYEESENSMETIRNESAKWQRQCDELRLKLEKEDLVKKKALQILPKIKRQLRKRKGSVQNLKKKSRN